MSMRLTSEAMLLKVGNPVRKLVLLKLADQANDNGECWPSYKTIAEAAECSRRSAVTHIDWLEKHGFLWIEERRLDGNRNLTNVYHLTLGKGKLENGGGSENPALGGETVALGGSENPALGGETVALGGSENPAPKPVNNNQSMNHINTTPDKADVEKPAKAKKTSVKWEQEALVALMARGVDEQLAKDYIAVRKDKGAKTLTETALNGLEREAVKAGLNLSQALIKCCERNWVGFDADWILGSIQKRSNRGGLTHNQTADVMDDKNYGDAPTTDF